MFPNHLDDAKVLEYTDRGHFGLFTDYEQNDTPIVKEICYFAICHYENEPSGYYLFSCDSQFCVLIDSCFETVEQCKNYRNLPADTVWHKK